jgi:hypothetical protein
LLQKLAGFCQVIFDAANEVRFVGEVMERGFGLSIVERRDGLILNIAMT